MHAHIRCARTSAGNIKVNSSASFTSSESLPSVVVCSVYSCVGVCLCVHNHRIDMLNHRTAPHDNMRRFQGCTHPLLTWAVLCHAIPTYTYRTPYTTYVRAHALAAHTCLRANTCVHIHLFFFLNLYSACITPLDLCCASSRAPRSRRDRSHASPERRCAGVRRSILNEKENPIDPQNL